MASDASIELGDIKALPNKDARLAQTLLQTAMDARPGHLPELSGEILLDQDGLRLTQDSFTFVTPRKIAFHYKIGSAVTMQLADSASEEECSLYLWGTVYGAVAWLNELVPLHASAVAIRDRSIGFAAPSGGGKSTIAAALAARGHALICDDTLVLSPSPEGMLAIPDGKPAKLWADTLDQVEVGDAKPIAAVPGKYFAQISNRATNTRRMDHLIFLEDYPELEMEQVKGSEKLNWLSTALYREELHMSLHDHEFHAKMMLRLVESFDIWILRRPMDRRLTQSGMDAIIRLTERTILS